MSAINNISELQPGQVAYANGMKIVAPDDLAEDLTREQTAAAREELIQFPRVVRKHQDDPIPNQTHSILSFNLLNEPKEVEEGVVYGFVKVRGSWPSKEAAVAHSTRVVRTEDSEFINRVCFTGTWVPIMKTTSTDIVGQEIDVAESEESESIQLRDQAHYEHVEKTRQVKRELDEAAERLKQSEKYNSFDDVWSLDYYTMKRVVDNELGNMIEETRARLEELEGKKIENLKNIRLREQAHPEYVDEWIHNYNAERAKSGIPEFRIEAVDLSVYEDNPFCEDNYDEDELRELQEYVGGLDGGEAGAGVGGE